MHDVAGSAWRSVELYHFYRVAIFKLHRDELPCASIAEIDFAFSAWAPDLIGTPVSWPFGRPPSLPAPGSPCQSNQLLPDGGVELHLIPLLLSLFLVLLLVLSYDGILTTIPQLSPIALSNDSINVG